MAATVSCIIPCFNDAMNLPKAVESCLQQGDDVEVIIVDDCSTDASFQVAQEIAGSYAERVRVFRNERNSGPALSRNQGVLHARGAFLCFLDSDDQYLPGFTGSCASLLTHNPGLAAVKALMEVVDPDGSRPLDADDPRLAAASSSYPCNMVVRKEVFLALGGFPTDARFRGPLGGEDDAFFKTLTALFRCLRIPQAFVRHNNRPGSHLETFLARTRVENGRMIFTHHDPALQEQQVIAATQEYFSQARQNLASLTRCALGGQAQPGMRPARESTHSETAMRVEEDARRISFVTTCKGRLHHLQQTLPLLAALDHAEVIVVDYGCPQGAGAWVEQHYPAIRVIRISDDPGFNVSRARNAGANAATAPWLCFIDADIVIQDGLLPWALENLRADAFYRPRPVDYEAYGSFFCTREAFLETGGYDEVIRGWGGEDDDFYLRLRLAGYREEGYPLALVAPIRHGDEERTAFYDKKNKESHHRVIQWYSNIKLDMMAIRGTPLPPAERMTLMQLAKQAAERVEQTNGLEETELFLNLGERMDALRFIGWEIQRKLVYRHSPRVAQNGQPLPSIAAEPWRRTS
jgi:glycosyltransferase involved in cell wall biosynthesis